MQRYNRFCAIFIVIWAALAAAIPVSQAKTVRVGIPGHNITQAAFYLARVPG